MDASEEWPWVTRVRSWIQHRTREWTRLLDVRISFIPVALGASVLFFSQGLDVVRDLVDSSNLYLRSPDGGAISPPALWSYFRWACFWAACIWSGLNAWYWPHLLTLSRTAEPEPRWFRFVRRTLGTVPTLAGLSAILMTGVGHLRDVWIAVAIFAVTAAFLPWLFAYRTTFVGRHMRDSWWRRDSVLMKRALVRFGGRRDTELTLGDDAFTLFTFVSALAALLIFSVPVLRVESAVHVGSASIAFGAVGTMIAMISFLLWLLSGTKVPVIAIGALAVILFSAFNDNHSLLAVSSDLAGRRPTVRQAFQRWTKLNPEGPIVLVASAGGASRAAYWTGQVLRSLDDRTGGAFGPHVFAISSVSGGTLGAFGYAAWIAEHPAGGACPYSPVERRAFDRAFLGGDYLPSALAGLLYPDLIQQFLPLPVFPDRARTLEESWESGWERSMEMPGVCRSGTSNRVSADFMEIWRTPLFGAGPWVPLVLANGTLVEDGKRVITAPVQVDPVIFEDSHDFVGLLGASVSTSTATLNSARFPLVSPAGTINTPAGAYHIVDGGYFENGGLETVYDLARYLRTIAPMRPILIIEINNDDAAPGDPHSVQDLGRYPNGMDPAGAARISLGVAMPEPRRATPAEGIRAIVGTFYQTRSSRGVLGAKRLSSLKAIGLTNTYRATFNLGPLLRNRKTAMSWSLSLSSREAMDGALQAIGPWLSAAEKVRISAAQAALGADVGCERVAADEIAASIGATVPGGSVNCATETNHARWVGVPTGLAPVGRTR